MIIMDVNIIVNLKTYYYVMVIINVIGVNILIHLLHFQWINCITNAENLISMIHNSSVLTWHYNVVSAAVKFIWLWGGGGWVMLMPYWQLTLRDINRKTFDALWRGKDPHYVDFDDFDNTLTCTNIINIFVFLWLNINN